MPFRVRTAMAHAVLQWTAERSRVDLLHIKGLAVDPSLERPLLGGTDADVLIRPDHVGRMLAALRASGWQQQSTFESDSDFGSAVTFTHPLWISADVHRFFPGIGVPAEEAFERLRHARMRRRIAGIDCDVPDLVGQSVILLLNAARAMGFGAPSAEIAVLWEAAPPERRAAIASLVEELGAEVAFAAATGGLERYRHRRDYDLWRIESQGGTRIQKWRARVRAEPTLRGSVRVAARALLVNVPHLTFVLGRPPTRSEVVREFFARLGRGAAEQLRSPGSRRGDRS